MQIQNVAIRVTPRQTPRHDALGIPKTVFVLMQEAADAASVCPKRALYKGREVIHKIRAA